LELGATFGLSAGGEEFLRIELFSGNLDQGFGCWLYTLAFGERMRQPDVAAMTAPLAHDGLTPKMVAPA